MPPTKEMRFDGRQARPLHHRLCHNRPAVPRRLRL